MRKGKRSLEGQYINLPYAMLKSPAWRSLSGAAVRLWLELHTRYNGGNNGAVRLSITEAADALGLGRATISRAFIELPVKGFLSLVKRGNWYHRQAHEWRLTTKPLMKVTGKVLPSHDWRDWHPPKKQKLSSEMEPSRYSVVPFENP